MKAFTCFAIAFILCLDASAIALEPKKDAPKQDDSIKCVMDQLETAWGIKFKSFSMKNEAAETYEFKITLEFTKDVNDVTMLKGVFYPSGRLIPGDFNQCPLVFHLFDEENVSLKKYVIKSLEGDLTGVKGDAFRILLDCDAESVKKAKKLKARLRDASKVRTAPNTR